MMKLIKIEIKIIKLLMDFRKILKIRMKIMKKLKNLIISYKMKKILLLKILK